MDDSRRNEPITRRDAGRLAGAAAVALAAGRSAFASPADTFPIVDTHQHLWDLDAQRLPWLEGATTVLKRSYRPADYAEATRGLGVERAVYMEVDVAADQHVDEAERVVRLCRSGSSPTRAAVIGGRPASPDFAAYLARFRETPEVKGVRQVLHSPATPAGYCLSDAFVEGVKALGQAGMSFDLCMRPGELGDGLKLVRLCPGTRFVLDHCGNADVNAFGKRGAEKPTHDPGAWKASLAGLAGQSNVICKISGIVARAPKGFTPDDLAPVVNHCLDSFGPDRVVFGGDWPVCLLGSPYKGWVEALRAIVSNRPAADQKKLWADNALKFYGLVA